MKKIVISLIIFYQKYLSPLKKPCCRFFPTCSEYAIGCIEKFGIIVGTLLSIKRFLKCNPMFRGGYDPVPKRCLRYKKPKIK